MTHTCIHTHSHTHTHIHFSHLCRTVHPLDLSYIIFPFPSLPPSSPQSNPLIPSHPLLPPLILLPFSSSLLHSLPTLFFTTIHPLEMFSPTEYTGALMDLGQTRRGIYIEQKYLTPERSTLIYEVPLAEVITDFFDQVNPYM